MWMECLDGRSVSQADLHVKVVMRSPIETQRLPSRYFSPFVWELPTIPLLSIRSSHSH